MQNIYLTSSHRAFRPCGLNNCVGAFYFYGAYNPRIQADQNLSTFCNRIANHIFFQDCLPDTTCPFYLNIYVPFFAPVSETNIYIIFFIRHSAFTFQSTIIYHTIIFFCIFLFLYNIIYKYINTSKNDFK